MRKGQTIVELILAFSVIIVGILALVEITTKSVSNSGYARRQSIATGYSNKAIEFLRGEKDRLGWDAFKSTYSGAMCYNGTTLSAAGATCGGMSTCGANLATEYSGCVQFALSTITPDPSGFPVDQYEVTSLVYWSDSGLVHNTKQSVIFNRY